VSVYKMKIKKYHTVGTIPKSNIVERGKIDTADSQHKNTKTQMYISAHFPRLVLALQ